MIHIQIVVTWAVLATIFTGTGLGIRRHLGLRSTELADFIEAAWLGWAALLGWLQLYHLFRPVDAIAAFVTILVSIGYIIGHLRSGIRTSWPARSTAGWFVLILIIAYLTAVRATGPVENYDTGLYHLDAIRWIEQFSIVPGLGNLHGRLAFNSSYFLYGAFVDQGPWTHEGHHIANGFLIVLLVGTCLERLLRVLTRRTVLFVADLFMALSFPAAVELIYGPNVTSFSPDLAVFAVGMVLLTKAIEILASPVNLTSARSFWFLAGAGLTLKLNFVCIAFPMGVVILAYRWINRDSPSSQREWIFTALLTVAFAAPWCLRGALTSGYLAYPSTFLSLPVDWRVPGPIATTEAIVVRSWAREPGTYWANIGEFSDWFPGWAERLGNDARQLVAVSAGSFALWIIFLASPQPVIRRRWQIALVGACATAILGWFWLAPDFRFAGSTWQNISALCLALGLGALTAGAPLWTGRAAVLAVILGFFLAQETPARLQAIAKSYRTTLAPLPVPAILDKVTASGLTVHVPINTIQTWGMSLPATHLFRSDLVTRRSGALSGGFQVIHPLEHLDGVGQNADKDLVSPDGIAGRFLDGWSKPESDGTRWLQTPGRILLYAQGAVRVRLKMRPGWLDIGHVPLEKADLACYVDDTLIGTLQLQRGMATDFEFTLRKGFNLVSFTVEKYPPDHMVFRRIKDLRQNTALAFQRVEIAPAGAP